MIWTKKSISTDSVRNISKRYGVDLLTASILQRRGIDDNEKVKFFIENELCFLNNPFLFDEMCDVADRINTAAEEGEKVIIFGDRDVDGITSTVLLYQELKSMGIDVSYTLPEGDDPYGMTIEKVQKAIDEKNTLFITVDCGISEVEQIAYARQHFVDTIVLDHHLQGDELPPAYAIIDPKVIGSGYPFEHLAGCGVVAKVIWALRFSHTDMYGDEIILLHSRPGNDTVIIQAVKMENLIITESLYEEINPGVVSFEKTRAMNFLSCGEPIIVLDESTEKTQLRKAFGKNVEINLVDIRKGVDEVVPGVKGRSLYTLSRISRSSKYCDDIDREIDCLVHLFYTYAMKKYPALGEGYDTILDLVAIGTIADLMPLENENRILIKRGLNILSQGRREALLPLMAMQNLVGKKLSTTDIGWNISPIINASGRLGCPEVAVEMLLSPSYEESEKYCAQLVQLNRQRQKFGEDAWERVLPKARRSYEEFGTKLVVVKDNQIKRGITGVMAARVLKQFNAPSIIIAKIDDDNYIGSMRSMKGFHSRDFLSNFADLFKDFGGHACAGGFSLPSRNYEVFLKRVNDVIDTMDCVEENDDTVGIDATIPENTMTPEIMKVVDFFEPYGQGFNSLVFQMNGAVIEDIKVCNNTKSGPQHLRFSLSYGMYKWPGIWWQSGDRYRNGEFDIGSRVDVAFRLGRNCFRNQTTLQLTIIDMHVV